jgi:hypothetical protein
MLAGQTAYLPADGGCVLPVARLGRLGWYVRGDGWTMQPRCAGKQLTLSEEKARSARPPPLRCVKRTPLPPPCGEAGK